MRVRIFALPVLCLAASACDLGGNIYPMTPDQVYSKLVEAKIKPSGKGPFGRIPMIVGGDGTSTVRWKTEFGTTMCEANITPEGADKSRIMAYCGAGGEGAAAGLTQALHRKAIIEHIDATLRGRDYDARLATGSTAGTWPADPRQADASLGGAATEALKMERDMKRMIKEGEAQQKVDKAEAAQRLEQARATQGVTFKPGQPMINPSN